MKRNITGNYSDKDSTRDLLDMTPKQFRVLIDAMRASIMQSVPIVNLSNEDLIDTFFKPTGQKYTLEQALEIKGKIIDALNVLHSIYNVANAAYPGATYKDADGKKIFGKEGQNLNWSKFQGCEYFEPETKMN